MLKKRDDYYPFGANISALSSSAPLSKPNKYKYNGNEEQTDFDLGLMDFNARFYDPNLGRFVQVDPLAESAVQYKQSPYQFGWNNPIRYNDPNGMCPICPALPWIGGAVLEGLVWTGLIGTSVYVAAEAGEDLADWSSPDPSTLTYRTESRPFEANGIHPKGSHNGGPDWSKATLALKIATATGLLIRLMKKTGQAIGEEDIGKLVEGMSPAEIESLIANIRIAERALASTDQQIFGLINPNLVEAASVYGIKKDLYGMDRPWLSEEERAKQQEEENKGRQASQLLGQAASGDLEAGHYTWDGSSWVRSDNK